MSREIKQDLLSLFDFIESYSLNEQLDDASYKLFISKLHKKYYSYLTFIVELNSVVNNTTFSNPINNTQFSYIQESCSDVGIAFFSSFHGIYKSSKLLLRSSIETFFKGFCLDEIPDLDKEKSIYELFRKVKTSSFFLNEPQKFIFNSIHNNYKLLCEDAHTATNNNMENISALNYFPSFNSQKADAISIFILNLTPNYLILLCLKYNQQYHTFHYKNRIIINSSTPKLYRQQINNLV
jgi:hypothetical protein